MMSTFDEEGIWHPSPDREEQVREERMSDEEFCAMTGANVEFAPPHRREWMIFWRSDICEKYLFHTWFPRLSLAAARRVWMAMEEHFLARYDWFLRVWAEWGSSGIWAPPYPGSRFAGGYVDYQYLPLPPELVLRFKAWQEQYDSDCEPWLKDNRFDWERHFQIADDLARDLKRCVGPRVYVEHRELVEALMDGTTRSIRPLIGLPDEG